MLEGVTHHLKIEEGAKEKSKNIVALGPVNNGEKLESAKLKELIWKMIDEILNLGTIEEIKRNAIVLLEGAVNVFQGEGVTMDGSVVCRKKNEEQ